MMKRRRKRSTWIDVVGWGVLALIVLKGAGWLTAEYLRESMARKAGFENHEALVEFAAEEVRKAERAESIRRSVEANPIFGTEEDIRKNLREEVRKGVRQRLIEEGLAE